MIVFTDSTPRKMTADDMLKMEKEIEELKADNVANETEIDYLLDHNEELISIVEHKQIHNSVLADELTKAKDKIDRLSDEIDLWMTRQAVEKVRADRLELSIGKMNDGLRELADVFDLDNQSERIEFFDVKV